MKVEYSENKSDTTKRKRKRKSRIKRIVAAVISIVTVILIAVILMLTVFFNVKSIKVVGSSIYTQEEIIVASGIMNGDNLLRMPKAEIKARIESALPYIKSAEIKRSFPETVGIKVTPAEEALVLKADNINYVLDADYKVLRTTQEIPENMLTVKGIKASELKCGSVLIFEDKQQKKALSDIIALCEEKKLSVGYIDIESLIGISFTVDNRLYVKIGSYNDLAGKINHLVAMMKSIDKSANASISLEDWSLNNKKAVLKYENINELIK